MAASRTEKIRTIFDKFQRLMRSGALPESDKPIWYDVYAAFPPKDPPIYNRPLPRRKIRKIFYPEDLIRVRYYKEIYDVDQADFLDPKKQTTCEKFIEKYYQIREKEPTNPDLFSATVSAMKAEGFNMYTWAEQEASIASQIPKPKVKPSARPKYSSEDVFGVQAAYKSAEEHQQFVGELFEDLIQEESEDDVIKMGDEDDDKWVSGLFSDEVNENDKDNP